MSRWAVNENKTLILLRVYKNKVCTCKLFYYKVHLYKLAHNPHTRCHAHYSGVVESATDREIKTVNTALSAATTTMILEEQCTHAAHLGLLLDEDLEVLVDDGDGQQDARARADGAQEVRQHGQRADTQAAERRRRRDVSVQLVDHRVVSVTAHHHLLFLQLLGDLRTNTLVSTHNRYSFACDQLQ